MENGSAKLALFLFIVLIALIAGGLYMLERMGMMDVSGFIMPKVVKMPYVGKYFQPEIVTGGMLKEEELAQREISLSSREKVLSEKETELKGLDEKLKQKEVELENRERDIFLREQAEKRRKEEAANVEKKLNQMAFYYSNMKPGDAARKLELVDNLLAVDILNRIPEKTTVAIILSKMSDNKSKELTRLMVSR